MMGFAGKKRVLIIVENLPVPFDRRVWQEATTLRDNGYQVSIICPKSKDYSRSTEWIDGIYVLRHPLPVEASGALGYAAEYSIALFWEFLLALRILLSRGFDIIHACNPPDTIFIIGFFFKLFGKKFVFDHHDINPELYEAKFSRKDIFYRLICALEKFTFRAANISIATNQSYRDIAIHRGGMNPSNVFIVRSGPKLDRLKFVDAVPQWKNNRPCMIGYVGVMGAQEGIDLLLEVVRHLVEKKERTDIQFCLVGGGTSLSEMKEYAVKLGIESYVTFTGRVSDEILLEVLNTADICVNPDIPNEMNDKSTMNKIMEYMALAKPIVQFDLKEGRYSAQDASLYAKNNDIESFADKILELVDNPELRQKMGEFGRKRVVEELSWDHEKDKLLEAYSEL